jgi:hypothetical protein
VVVRRAGGSSGVRLVEVYNLPSAGVARLFNESEKSDRFTKSFSL